VFDASSNAFDRHYNHSNPHPEVPQGNSRLAVTESVIVAENGTNQTFAQEETDVAAEFI